MHRLEIDLRARAEMLLEHDVSAKPQEETVQSGGALAIRVARAGRARSKRIGGGVGIIDAGMVGRIERGAAADRKIESTLGMGHGNT